MWREIVQEYRGTLTDKDNFWIRRATRPVAAIFVYFLKDKRITANQVSFLSVGWAILGAITLIFWRSYAGLLAGIAFFQMAFVFDCVDGQLARLRGTDSDLGLYVDFLTDEIRAYIFFASVALRLFLLSGQSSFLVIGIIGLVLIATGISLTTFIRRPEYSSSGAAKEAAAKGIIGTAYKIGKFLVHYPSYVVYLAIINRIEIYFYVYLVAIAIHVGRTSLSVILKAGRLQKKEQ